MTLDYDTIVYDEAEKNLLSPPILESLDRNHDNLGAKIRLKTQRDDVTILDDCGYDIPIRTPHEVIVDILKKIVAKWNSQFGFMNTQVNRKPVTDEGQGRAFQAIPTDGSICKSKLVFGKDDYSMAVLFPFCEKDFVYIDKFRTSTSRHDKMLDDYVVQVIQK